MICFQRQLGGKSDSKTTRAIIDMFPEIIWQYFCHNTFWKVSVSLRWYYVFFYSAIILFNRKTLVHVRCLVKKLCIVCHMHQKTSNFFKIDKRPKKYIVCQFILTSWQHGFNNIQSISSIGQYFNKLPFGFINFSKMNKRSNENDQTTLFHIQQS